MPCSLQVRIIMENTYSHKAQMTGIDTSGIVDGD
jgi:hypothetical protein